MTLTTPKHFENTRISFPFYAPKRSLWFAYGKRPFDIIFSLTALFLSLPLFILITFIVAISSPGPVFYSSFRIGQGGKLFKCWKFRSMFLDAENRLEGILAKDPQLRAEWDKFLKFKKDPRLTSFGKFLRKTSLDEWPQFWNVLKGELSVVGPRPFLPNEISRIQHILKDTTNYLFLPRPGLTGIWQTSGRSNLTFQERVELDIHYFSNCSMLSDIKLICKTIPMLFFPKGAR